ncbi:MAG: S8 family peptidase [Ignavibacteriales bacterium]|nr:MAG: S8 family peptidase [Ignavibacteriales bacterium]
MKKFLFPVILFYVISFQFVLAQEQNIVRGEIIVQLNAANQLNNFKDAFQNLDLKIKQLLSKRMNIWLCTYNETKIDVSDVLYEIRTHRSVKSVQFNHVLSERSAQIFDLNNYNPYTVLSTFPNDTRFNEQWALHNTGQSGGTVDADIDAPEAWDISTGGLTADGDTIVIAIIDGGCDLNHNDLPYWYNYGEIPSNGIDDDSNGYIDDYRGWNAYGNNGTVPGSSHGTHVAGISGAKGNNNLGVSGVNWNSRIMPIAGSSSSEATVIAAYGYVLEMRSLYNETNGVLGAFIVSTNASFGVDQGQPANYPLWCAIYDSLGVQGVLNCGATANANWNIDVVGDIPTGCPSPYMISVTNTTRTDAKNSGAAYGLNTIDLGAPGTSVLSTYPNNNYQNLTGTSMATPQVTGAIALMFAAADSQILASYKSNLSDGAIMFRDILFEATDSISALQGITVTGGRLNVYNALLPVSAPQIPVELVSFSAEANETSVSLSWITSTEVNNRGFEVERKNVGRQSEIGNQGWGVLGFVEGKGTTTEQNFYSFSDKNVLTGKYQYRLKQIDYDGSYEYSKVVDVDLSRPNTYSLEQNYPNPFNPTTKIKFTVGDAFYASLLLVKLTVFDVLGNEIVTLVNEEKSAGVYEIEFDASNLPSGIYFYKLQSAAFSQTNKMLLLK